MKSPGSGDHATINATGPARSEHDGMPQNQSQLH